MGGEYARVQWTEYLGWMKERKCDRRCQARADDLQRRSRAHEEHIRKMMRGRGPGFIMAGFIDARNDS